MLDLRSLLAGLLLLVCMHTLTAMNECEPDCSHHNNGDFVEDPWNCTNFYVCMAGSPTHEPVTCPTGHFDPSSSQCVGDRDCNSTCTSPPCNLACKAPGDFVSDPKNCESYYICNGALESEGPFPCPSDKPFFNGETCGYDDDQCCVGYCNPYCKKDDVQIIDPKDCHKYYICLGAGKPLEVNHRSCQVGENFDVASSRCKKGHECIIMCGSISITTTTASSGGGGGDDCISSFTCPSAGNFPQCKTCQPGYFQCVTAGAQGVATTCPDNKVFNTNLNFPYCILPSSCPFNPFLYKGWEHH